ncbi:MAG: flagellar biosynthetic protein FliR [Pseudomonadota bacterium]
MLAALLSIEIFAVAMIFVRVGTALIFLPGFGEAFIPIRIRLAAALLITLVVSPVVGTAIPPMPAQVSLIVLLILGESFVGLFLGLVARIIMSALSVAGMVISNMSALANALTNDPTAAQQGSIISSFLTMLGLLLIMVLNIHHLLLMAVIDSYALFVPGAPIMVGDFADVIAQVVSKSFILGFQLASPFVAFGIVFYLALGLLSRLMPQMQVFFIAMPLQIAMGLVVLFFALPVMIRWFLSSFEEIMLPVLPF